MLAYAGLLAAAAAGLGSPEPGAPSGGRAREEPPPGNELPAGSAARPQVRRRPTTRPGPSAPETSGPQLPHPERAPPELQGRPGGGGRLLPGRWGARRRERGPGLAWVSSFVKWAEKRLACGGGPGGLDAAPLHRRALLAGLDLGFLGSSLALKQSSPRPGEMPFLRGLLGREVSKV